MLMTRELHLFAAGICIRMMEDPENPWADVLFNDFVDSVKEYHERCAQALASGDDDDSVVFTMSFEQHIETQQFFIEEMDKHPRDVRYQQICRHHFEARKAHEARARGGKGKGIGGGKGKGIGGA